MSAQSSWEVRSLLEKVDAQNQVKNNQRSKIILGTKILGWYIWICVCVCESDVYESVCVAHKVTILSLMLFQCWNADYDTSGWVVEL